MWSVTLAVHYHVMWRGVPGPPFLGCTPLFLKFSLGKMAKCMEFQDYLQAGVHDSVRDGAPAASWAKAKMRLTKSLRHLGDSPSQWLQTFASASRFGGTEDALIENLIGYTLKEQVQINMTTGARTQEDIRPPGGTRSVEPMPARGRASSALEDAPDTSKESPIDVVGSRTWRWVPRHGERPMGVQSFPDPFEQGHDSKDDQGVSRYGGHGPEPLRVSEPSAWQRWPDVQPAAPVNDECPRERTVESRI